MRFDDQVAVIIGAGEPADEMSVLFATIVADQPD